MSHVLRIGPRTILLDQPRFVIGSGPHCDCRIVSEGVQPSHAALLQTARGVSLLPLEGRTFLNEVEVSNPAAVSHAMTIRVGRVEIQLVDTDAAERERLVTQQVEAQDVVAVLADAMDAIDDALEDQHWEAAASRVRIAGDNIGDDTASRRFLDPLCHRATMIGRTTNDPRWIDWTLELCGRHRHVPSSGIVDALVDLSNATSWRPAQILDYAKSVADSGPIERVRLRRLLALG